MNQNHVTFRVVYAAKDLAEFRSLMTEFPALATPMNAPSIARAASPISAIIGDSEERKLRDEWKKEMGKNFSFKKTMRANYASPMEALRAWKNGEMSRADFTSANDDSAPSFDRESIAGINPDECV